MPKGIFIPFTKDQEQKIKDEYLDKPVKRLAKELGVSGGRIMRFLKKNNLEIPADVVQSRIRNSRLKKGHVPFNKGLAQSDFMSKEAIERTKKTRFKKGRLPHNTKHDGVVVSRTDNSGRFYKYIRIKKGVWELYHRVVWERAHGKIPSDHIIVFKDGNSKNADLKNLKLITKKENMFRNSVHEYPEEIIPSLVLSKQLEDKLKLLQNG